MIHAILLVDATAVAPPLQNLCRKPGRQVPASRDFAHLLPGTRQFPGKHTVGGFQGPREVFHLHPERPAKRVHGWAVSYLEPLS